MTSAPPPQNTAGPPERIGWIGTGVMGAAMCGHLLRGGWPVRVHNRSRRSAEPLLAAGAVWVEHPAALAADCTVVFTMLGYPRDVRQVYLAPDGLLASVRSGCLLVDMTTSEPSLAQEIALRAVERGAAALDAPVSGGDVGARNATLSIMVGGEAGHLDRVLPMLQRMGRNIALQGAAGAGQHTKMCNQVVIAGTMVGVCEALLYGFRAGLDLTRMLAAIRGGAAACWALDNLAPRILKRDFDPGFFVKHFIKDMEIALKEARRMGIVLPGLALVHQLYLAVQAGGGAERGTQALMLALERLSAAEPAAAARAT
jgi:3-hydroxyisobutyrate dehydrogenase